MLRSGWILAGIVLATAVHSGEALPPPAFTVKPTAVKAGDRVRIEFAVNRETDVAVSMEDAGGKVVRHLVAGVLGKNPPSSRSPRWPAAASASALFHPPISRPPRRRP